MPDHRPEKPETKDAGQDRRELELELDAGGPALELDLPAAAPARTAPPMAGVAFPEAPGTAAGGVAGSAPPLSPASSQVPLLRSARPVEKTFDAPPVASLEISTRTKIIAVLVVLAIGGVILRWGLRAPPTDIQLAEARGELYQISDNILAGEFGRNAARATRAYGGHRLRIVGRFAKVRLDFGGQNALQLIGNGAWLIDAVLRPDVFKSLSMPQGGALVTVECVVRGMTDEYVRVDDCTLPDQAP